MNNEYLKQQLAAITYKDDVDIVALRYLLLNALAESAAEYKKAQGTAYAFKLLQVHRKLEDIHTTIKEKSRNNSAVKEDFLQAKYAAAACMENFAHVEVFVTAA